MLSQICYTLLHGAAAFFGILSHTLCSALLHQTLIHQKKTSQRTNSPKCQSETLPDPGGAVTQPWLFRHARQDFASQDPDSGLSRLSRKEEKTPLSGGS